MNEGLYIIKDLTGSNKLPRPRFSLKLLYDSIHKVTQICIHFWWYPYFVGIPWGGGVGERWGGGSLPATPGENQKLMIPPKMDTTWVTV